MNEIITQFADTVGPLVKNNLPLATAMVAFFASWVLYGVLGKRFLGADDDYWETIRATVIPLMEGVAERYGLYVHTTTGLDEYAGYTTLNVETVEVKLKEAGYLRQPLASLHENPSGKLESGSWSRPYGPLYPISRLLKRLPVLGTVPARFLRSVDTVLALKQTHVMLYEERLDGQGIVEVYAHSEWNPLNPVTAYWHYSTDSPSTPTPEKAREHLAAVEVELHGGE